MTPMPVLAHTTQAACALLIAGAAHAYDGRLSLAPDSRADAASNAPDDNHESDAANDRDASGPHPIDVEWSIELAPRWELIPTRRTTRSAPLVDVPVTLTHELRLEASTLRASRFEFSTAVPDRLVMGLAGPLAAPLAAGDRFADIFMRTDARMPAYGTGSDDFQSTALLDESLASLTPESRSTVTFNFGRTTALRDGGIDGARPALDPHTSAESDDHLRSYAQPGAEFDLYDLNLEWAALNPGPLTLSFIGGVRAIRAELNQSRETIGPSGESFTTTDDGRGMVTVPVVGGGVRWALSEALHLRTAASTQTVPSGAAYLDLVAETGIRFSPNISFTAGYQFVESRLEIDDIEAELNQEGLFARLQIKF